MISYFLNNGELIMFDSTAYAVPDSRNVFLSPVYIATVLICAAVNWVFCFAYILIVAFVIYIYLCFFSGHFLRGRHFRGLTAR